MIRKQLYLRRTELYTIVLAAIGGFLMGTVILGFLSAAGELNEELFEIGTILALVVGFLMQIGCSTFGFAVSFNTAVSMGQTRRKIVPGYTAVSAIETAVLIGTVYVSHLAAEWMHERFWPEYPMELNMEAFFSPGYLLPFFIGLIIVELLFEAFFMRFGTKVLWAIWGVFMLPAFIGNGMAMLLKKYGNSGLTRFLQEIWEQIMGFGVYGWIGMGLAAALLLTAVSWKLLRKQEVTAL